MPVIPKRVEVKKKEITFTILGMSNETIILLKSKCSNVCNKGVFFVSKAYLGHFEKLCL